MLKLEDVQHIDRKSGIYALLENNKIVYIGRSRNVYQRVLEHIVENKKEFSNVRMISNDDDIQMDIMEVILISVINPKYNILKIDKEIFIKTLPFICQDHIPKKLNQTIEFMIDALQYGYNQNGGSL